GVLAARYLSVGLHAAIVVLAGLAGGWLARRRFAWLPAGLVALWSAVVGGPPLAWWAALAAAFATVVTLARVTGARGPWWLAGGGPVRLPAGRRCRGPGGGLRGPAARLVGSVGGGVRHRGHTGAGDGRPRTVVLRRRDACAGLGLPSRPCRLFRSRTRGARPD